MELSISCDCNKKKTSNNENEEETEAFTISLLCLNANCTWQDRLEPSLLAILPANEGSGSNQRVH